MDCMDHMGCLDEMDRTERPGGQQRTVFPPCRQSTTRCGFGDSTVPEDGLRYPVPFDRRRARGMAPCTCRYKLPPRPPLDRMPRAWRGGLHVPSYHLGPMSRACKRSRLGPHPTRQGGVARSRTLADERVARAERAVKIQSARKTCKHPGTPGVYPIDFSVLAFRVKFRCFLRNRFRNRRSSWV